MKKFCCLVLALALAITVPAAAATVPPTEPQPPPPKPPVPAEIILKVFATKFAGQDKALTEFFDTYKKTEFMRATSDTSAGILQLVAEDIQKKPNIPDDMKMGVALFSKVVDNQRTRIDRFLKPIKDAMDAELAWRNVYNKALADGNLDLMAKAIAARDRAVMGVGTSTLKYKYQVEQYVNLVNLLRERVHEVIPPLPPPCDPDPCN